MDTQEKDKILLSAKLFEARGHESLLWEDPYSDMTPDEKSKLII